jgi:hypothetical protein
MTVITFGAVPGIAARWPTSSRGVGATRSKISQALSTAGCRDPNWMLRMFSFGSASFATISVSFGGQFFREGLFKNHGTLPNPMAYTTLGGIPYFQMHPFCVVWDLYHVGQVSFKAPCSLGQEKHQGARASEVDNRHVPNVSFSASSFVVGTLCSLRLISWIFRW